MKVKESLELSAWPESIFRQKYSMEGKETWSDTAERVVSNVLGALGYDHTTDEYQQLLQYITERKFIPGGRYLYSAGRPLHQVNNCFLAYAEDSREGWSDLLHKAAMVLQTGGGFGVEYSDIRPYGSPIKKTGGIASGPLPLMQMVNEIGRGVMQGGSRRSALIALLDWDHDDIEGFIHYKDWPDEIKQLKEKDFNAFAPMDMTNISINLDDKFFEEVERDRFGEAAQVFDKAVRNMVTTGEPGFSINLDGYSMEKLRNPCSEVTSADDSDVCNLGSINLSRVESLVELESIVNLASLFLLAGTVYSDVPYEKVNKVREKNRRIGLGVMGVHEFNLKHGHTYEPNDDLADWMGVYAEFTRVHANRWADTHNLSRPIATRAIAPTGTIGILGETTTGVEPIFCTSYARRYLADGTNWHHQYVVDPTAKRLIEEGIPVHEIEDAYTLSYNIEKRIKFQAWIQQYVDMGVSSTINLPEPITDESEISHFKEVLLKYLPELRGITCYPDGARGGQPLVPVNYEDAVNKEGVVFKDDIDASCRNGVCGA